ncbi:unnamed protein product [Gordionus sp. m RMFG-2023]
MKLVLSRVKRGKYYYSFKTIWAFEMLKTKEALENIIAYNPLETRLNVYQQTWIKDWRHLKPTKKYIQAYRYLKSHFCMPPESTLRAWSHKIEIMPGFLSISFT